MGVTILLHHRAAGSHKRGTCVKRGAPSLTPGKCREETAANAPASHSHDPPDHKITPVLASSIFTDSQLITIFQKATSGFVSVL